MVRRLREAGAIIVGLTLLPEMAICGFSESATYGVTRNPWNPQRTPGGSSGGSGSAVAAGLVPIASAGDGAGSIRIPAASCGLFGLKVSRGRVSLAPNLEGWRGLAVEGCLSRSVLDTALWLDVVSGGSREPEAPPPPERPFVEAAKTPPGKLRVAWSTLAPRARRRRPSTTRPRGAVADAADAARAGSATRSPSATPTGATSATTSPPASSAGWRRPSKEVPHPERLESRTRGFGRLGSILPARLYEKARNEGRAADAARVNAIFDHCDVLVMPVMGGTALPVRRWEGKGALQTVLGMSRFYPYCVPWNHLGNPAMAVPAGFSPRACRSRSRSSAAPATRRRCSRSPPSSRPSGPGRTRRPPIS